MIDAGSASRYDLTIMHANIVSATEPKYAWVIQNLLPEQSDAIYSDGFRAKKNDVIMHREPRQRHIENLEGEITNTGRKNIDRQNRNSPMTSTTANTV